MFALITLAFLPGEAEKYRRYPAFEKRSRDIIFIRNLLYIEAALALIELLAIAGHIGYSENSSRERSCYSTMAPWGVAFVATNALVAATAKRLHNEAQGLLALHSSSVQVSLHV